MIALSVARDTPEDEAPDGFEAREIRLECLRMAVSLEGDSDDAMTSAERFLNFVLHGPQGEAEGHDVH